MKRGTSQSEQHAEVHDPSTHKQEHWHNLATNYRLALHRQTAMENTATDNTQACSSCGRESPIGGVCRDSRSHLAT